MKRFHIRTISAIFCTCMLGAVGVGTLVDSGQCNTSAHSILLSITAHFRSNDARPIFKLSVVLGGLANSRSFYAAQSDPLVREHYAQAVVYGEPFQASAPLLRYASYRRNNKIYWSRHQMTVQPGEFLLHTSMGLIRDRCGNRLSSTPQLPVEDEKHGGRAEGEMNETVPGSDDRKPMAGRPLPDLETAKSTAYVPTLATPFFLSPLLPAQIGSAPNGASVNGAGSQSASGFPIASAGLAGAYFPNGYPLVAPLVATADVAVAPEPSSVWYSLIGIGAFCACRLICLRGPLTR